MGDVVRSLGGISPALGGQVPPIRFRNLAFGSQQADVAAQLKDFACTAQRADVMSFHGEVAGDAATVTARFTPVTGHLYAVQVEFEPEYHGSYQVLLVAYHRLRDVLVGKYGTPTTIEHAFQTPYVEGGGEELKAIAVGWARIAAGWLTPEATLAIELTTRRTPRISYVNVALEEVDASERAAIAAESL